MKSAALFIAMFATATAHAELGGQALISQTLSQVSQSESRKAHPEARLVEALDVLSDGDADAALGKLAELVEDRPNFRLAQLIYGDLLSARAGGVTGLKVDARSARLKALIDEARLRWRQRQQAQAANAVPDVLLRFALQEERAVLVDLKASRLYVLWSVGGRPRVLEDHYIGIGKSGIGKRREGDRRTPVGVYRITEYLPKTILEDRYDENAYLYGVGALPVSYPNLHDRLLGRTGSGIWLHGVPDQTYVRPPRSSRGCVTMANDDFTRLLKAVVPGQTLVIFSDGVEWLSPEKAKEREADILAALDHWRQAWAASDSDGLFEHYAENFLTEETDLAGFIDHHQRVRAELGNSEIEIDQLSVMEYPGEKDMMLVTFRQTLKQNGLRGYVRKQQYWQRDQDGQWRIFREGVESGV